MQEVPKIQLAEEAANRWQDVARKVLNAFVHLRSADLITLYTPATRPVAAEGQAGMLIRVRDTNKPEQLQCCLLNANGSYSWVVVAQASQ